MMNRVFAGILAVTAWLASSSVSSAQIITVDNFSAGLTTLLSNTAPAAFTSSNVRDPNSGTISGVIGGGVRYAYMEKTLGGVNRSQTLTRPADGLMTFAQALNVNGNFALYYGYDQFGSFAFNDFSASNLSNTGSGRSFLGGSSGMSVDASTVTTGNSAFKVLVTQDAAAAVSPGSLFRVHLISGIGGTPQMATVDRTLATTATTELSFDYSDFLADNASLNFADIDVVVFRLVSTQEAGDIDIEFLQFGPVPEPSTYALIAAGGFGFVFYRRLRRRFSKLPLHVINNPTAALSLVAI